MGFFHEIISNIEQGRGLVPEQRSDLDEVLKFAPKRKRLDRQSQYEQTTNLESELRNWQHRAIRAEARLKFVETSVQQIAKRYARAGT
jgi:hypothetical protein